jgi:hypothetical protein
LWLIKVWLSASTFVVKIATFAKPQTGVFLLGLVLSLYMALKYRLKELK